MTAQAVQDQQALQDAFQAFNRMSAALESSYRELEQRVAGLTAELAASRSERLALADRLETLIDLLPGGLLVLDRDGIIREWNSTAESLLGGPLAGRRWRELADRLFRDGQADGTEVRLADGRWLAIARRPLEAEGGLILLINDVTETRALREALARRERLSAMGEMVAALAHQIRTPLSAALLYASQLGGGQLDGETRERFAGRLTERLRHLERLVDDMLAFARGGALRGEAFTLGALFEELQALLAESLESGALRLEIDCHDPACGLSGNVRLLAGALANMVVNSLEAGGGRARVDIVTSTLEEGGIRLRLGDDGPGVPEDLAERIFQPFFTGRADGTGLGLAIVQATVRAHGGDIRLESRPAGGALFIIDFPPPPLADALPSGAENLASEGAEHE